MYATRAENHKRIKLKILILALAIFFLTACIASFSSVSKPVKLYVFPEVPQEGEPIVATFSMKNFGLVDSPYTYTLYANGEEVMSGKTVVSPLSTKKYQYAYVNNLKVGEKVSFVLKVTAKGETYEEVVTAPPYHPYVWSSFVSFAAFSTTMTTTTTTTTTITSLAYYQTSFGVKQALNVGAIFAAILIGVLLHVEVTEPFHNNMLNILGRIRRRFSKLSAILFIIFITMVFTNIIMIIG